MDRNIYKYVTDELLKSPDISFKFLPVSVVQKPWEENKEFNSNLIVLLNSIKEKIANQSSYFLNVPELLLLQNSPLSEVFRQCHVALLEVIQGVDPKNHFFKPNGIQLLKFLTACAFNGIDQAFCCNDCSCVAMLCFLMEGLMFCGWSPDSFEGNAKRSAHEYCITAKKCMYRSDRLEKGIVIGYLWGAWALAEKTEGIRVKATPLPSSQKIEWHIDGFTHFYLIEKTVKPSLFYMLSYSHHHIPHPFSAFSHDEYIGLSVIINNEIVNPERLISIEEISRIKKHGYVFRHECATRSMKNIIQTTAILIFENTFYKIDSINLPPQIHEISISAILQLEIPNQCKVASELKSGIRKAPVVELMENPLGMAFERILDSGIAIYSSKTISMATTSPIRMTTAWSFSPGAAAIDRTHLLGMYD